MSSEKINKASSFWDDNVKLHEKPSAIVSWLDSPLVMEHCLKKLKVGEKVISVIQWLLWVKEKHVPSTTLDYGLSLGCGDGTLERHALSLNICSRFDAYDISSKSIEIAKDQSREKAFADRIHYEVADLNNIALERNKYDIIFSGMALHHLHNLEHVLFELRESLKPNGLFLLIEFVGPSQFQWTDKQLRIIGEILEILPERLKVDTRTRTLKKYCLRPSIESMNASDPSEAIRSADILPLVYKMWNVEERIDYGGTISHMLFDGIIANFDPMKEEDIAILKLIEYIDDILIRETALPSDFTLIVARKKPSGADDAQVPETQRQSPVSINIDMHGKAGLVRKFMLSLKENGLRYTAEKVLSYVRNHFF